jgi:DNA-3-methyladenine glycosylase
MAYPVLPRTFYERDDVVQISRDLIGKVLVTETNEGITSGIITETEAYCGRGDRACHSKNGVRTNRTEIMYARGGLAYVYLCYGIHHLFNVVTNREGLADAVLIRAVEPLDGTDLMLLRRNMSTIQKKLTAGPGILSSALGITTADYGTDLITGNIRIEDRGIEITPSKIKASKRIGVEYAGDDALRKWRFLLSESPFVSRPA